MLDWQKNINKPKKINGDKFRNLSLDINSPEGFKEWLAKLSEESGVSAGRVAKAILLAAMNEDIKATQATTKSKSKK